MLRIRSKSNFRILAATRRIFVQSEIHNNQTQQPMSDTKLGQLIGFEAQRDAIHIAIAPVVSAGSVKPGEHIGFMDDGRVGIRAKVKLGIADPFLKADVQEGERFYMFLYPQTVTGMRHEWQHPEFPINFPACDNESKRSLEAMAERCGCSLERLLERLDLYAEGSCGPDDSIQEKLNRFGDEIAVRDMWANYERCRMTKVDESIKTDTYFRCAC